MIRKMLAVSVLSLLALYASGRESSAAGQTTIAVLDFRANNSSASEAVVIGGLARSAVVKRRRFAVVDKGNMDRLLAEQAFQQSGCTSEECAVKLGKILNVGKIVVGEYTLLGTMRFLTASVVDVETGKIESSGQVKGFQLENADRAIDDLLAQLFSEQASSGQGQSGVTPSAIHGHGYYGGSILKKAVIQFGIGPMMQSWTEEVLLYKQVNQGITNPYIGLQPSFRTSRPRYL